MRLAIGAPTETVVPPIGLGQDRDHHVPDTHEREVLAALAPRHLRVELRLDGDWRSALVAAQETATGAGAHLEVSLHLLERQAGEIADVAAALAAGPPVDRVLVINGDSRTGTPTEVTRPALVGLARDGLGAVCQVVAGGTEIYFTDVNRSRPDLSGWDGLCFSITPQIHAFTDTDVVENLDAQGENVRSARAIAGAKPVIVSPITMRRRVNFHAAGDPPPTAPGELPDSVDVRQSSLYGAAWTAGSLKYMSESGASSVTYYETTGWRGVVERAGGSELPKQFRSVAGEVFPLYHPLADAAEWRGAEVLACESSDVLAAVGLAVRTPDGERRVLLANLTPFEREVIVGPLQGELSLRRLNETTAAQAASDPIGVPRELGKRPAPTGSWSSRWRRTRWCASIAPSDGLLVVRRNAGRARCQSVTAWTAAPARRTRPSRQRVEASWAPIGAPVEVTPHGIDRAGRWAKLSRCVYGATAAVVSTVSAPSAGGASTGIVGSSSRSTPESASSTVSAKRDCSRRSARSASASTCGGKREPPPRALLEQFGGLRQGLAVDVERLRLDQQPASVDRLFPPVELDRRQVRAALREHGGDRSDRGGDVLVGSLDERLDHPDAESLHRVVDRQVEHLIERGGIAGVEAGDRREERADVRHRACERPHRVQGDADRLHAVVRDGAECRSQTRDAAQRSRQPHRPARVGADRRDAEVGGHGGAGAAARPARDPVGRGRVDDRAERLVRGRRAEGQLVEVRLAEDHAARRANPSCHLGVGRRDPIGEKP